MSANIYNETTGQLEPFAGRESADYWEGTQAQWEALNASEKAAYTGKYVIITDDEDDVINVYYRNAYNITDNTIETLVNNIIALMDKEGLYVMTGSWNGHSNGHHTIASRHFYNSSSDALSGTIYEYAHGKTYSFTKRTSSDVVKITELG